MRIVYATLLVSVILLPACASGRSARPIAVPPAASSTSGETSAGARVPADDASLPRADAAGKTPADVVTAYVNAVNASDARTVASLHAKGPDDPGAVDGRDVPQPFKNFAIHESRVTAAGRALVRVTYATRGVSALDNTLKSVVVGPPGEWWVIEQSEGLWRVTSKDPWDQ